jgi:hypothetical protein
MVPSAARKMYKSGLFADYFASDDARLIEAYNALGGHDFPLDSEIEYVTLKDVLHGGVYNDLAFTIAGRYVALIEHQSTPSAMLPLRMLLYVAKLYEAIVDSDKLYMRKLSKIPTPEFIVIYNGTEPLADKQVLRLSDAFMANVDAPALELVVDVYNVAAGHNAEMLAKSRSLSDYSAFVSMVEDLRTSGVSLDDAMKRTILECKKNGIMAAYLENRGSEVLSMLLTEWNMEDALRVARQEEREDERQKAEAKDRDRAKRMKADGYDTATIARYFEFTPAEIMDL